MSYRKRKYVFTPSRKQADKTFLVASLFEGAGYVGRFNNRTGERIGTVIMGSEDRGDDTNEVPEVSINNKNQISLF
jgi:hypothetical protein